MYEAYWRLAAKPFDNSFDGQFFYPCETHQGVLLKLRYAVESQREAAVIVGASGLGKTFLIKRLEQELGEPHVPFHWIDFPCMAADELLHYLADELESGVPTPTGTRDASVRRIRSFLRANQHAQRHPVIVLEEAHWLREESSWQVVRLLLNLERGDAPAFTLLLSGQPELLPQLDRSAELNEHLDVRCVLRRFSPEETAGYVAFRLETVGGEAGLFHPSALDAVHQISQGIPRRINRLCDYALLVGFAESLSDIRAEQIFAVHEELAGAPLRAA